jgi:predicted amidophosphoribosyltransferase
MRVAPVLAPPVGVDRCLAPLAYAGAARELVARLKYRNARASVRWLAGAMVALVDEPITTVVWVPTTAARRHERGFDQAEVLARAIARRIGSPCLRALRRHQGAPQTGADAATRLSGPVLEPRYRLGGTVLLVDDVTTTGATLTAAAFAVRDAGAVRVIGLVAARTPLPGDLH